MAADQLMVASVYPPTGSSQTCAGLDGALELLKPEKMESGLMTIFAAGKLAVGDYAASGY